MSTNIRSAAALGNAGTVDSLSLENRQKLSDLAAEFESMLLTQMLRDMSESGKWESLGENGLDTLGAKTFDETFQLELSRYLAKSGGLGLSQQLLKALDSMNASADATAEPSAGTRWGMPAAAASTVRTGWNGLSLEAPAYGGSGAEWAGFNNDRAMSGGDDSSVKDGFFRWTYGLGFNPAGKSKGEIEQYLRSNIESARDYGLNIIDVEGEHILVETQENGPEWIDVVVNAGSANPGEVKWQWQQIESKPVPASAMASVKSPVLGNSLPLPVAADLSLPASMVTSAYGWRQDPFTGESKFHKGVDLRASEGADVPSAGAGRVTFSGTDGAYGTSVIVQHSNGLSTRYAHLSEALVKAGDEVADRQVIGRAGQTGRATAAHLHFEVLEDGVPVDPLR